MRIVNNGFPTWIEISREALHHNLDCLEIKKDPAVKLGLVVKANAYGHGLDEIVRCSMEHKAVSYFFTAYLEEALEVKSLGVVQPVCSLVPADTCFLSDALEKRIECVCSSVDYLEYLSDIACRLKIKARVHLKCDTGLSRLGVSKKELDQMIDALKRHQTTCELVGVMSHFSDVVSENISFAQEQRRRFESYVSYLKGKGLRWSETHLGASGALSLSHKDSLVRVGTALYGYWKSSYEKERTCLYRGSFEWKPVLTWKTRVMHLLSVEKGVGVGYGQTFIAPHFMRLAVLPVGYFDGYAREFSNKGKVWISGNVVPVVGKVSMNLLIIDVSRIPNVRIGDEVVLLGDYKEVTAYDLADCLKTVHIDILSRIRLSIPRIIV